MLISVGIDLGTSKTAVYTIGGLRSPVLIQTSDKTPDKVRHVTDKVKLCVIETASIIVIEKPFNVMGNGRILLELLGAVKYALDPSLRIVQVPQTSLKKFATGMGNAQKSDMVLRAFKEFGLEAASEDEIDAFWLALLGQYILNMPTNAYVYRKETVDTLLAPKAKKGKKKKKEGV